MDNKLFLVFSVVVSVKSAPHLGQKTFLDIPTGHCDPICSCEMDNLYYSEGERWAKPGDPCTVFTCSKNGVVETVKRGCMYKGDCYSVDSTWTEGCNTFTCTGNSNFTSYMLTNAGCTVSSGGCLNVGERRIDGCDLLECQLNGGYLDTMTIDTGCAADGTCKRIGSYWHDGCTVYTCSNETGVAVKQSLMNEVMQWPEGNYALLKPKTGCPSDVPKVWSEGSRKHYGAGRNFFSEPLSLAGSYVDEYMRHDFCIHGTNTESAVLPKYKTFWEPGSYCILRRNGLCPRGFTDGYVAFDDNDTRAKSVSTGILPDGDFTSKTGLYFCCRKDGSVQTEIVLPKDESFVLFIERGQKKCQTVKGMSSSVEFFSFDGLLTSKHEKRGHIPYAKFSDGDVKLNVCHYKPATCGCTDESGQTIPVNTEKEIDCVVKRCVFENGKRVIKIVSGGCRVNGKCEPEGHSWSVNEGETCRTRTCEKVFVGAGKTTFQINNGFPGCRDGEVCRNLGEEVYRDCFTRVCTQDTTFNTTTLKVVKADCPWYDTCKAPASTWEYNCMTYRCDMNTLSGHYQWNVQPINYACEWNNTCYKEDDVWSDGCIQYKCIVTRVAGAVNWSVKTFSLACRDLKGNCLPVGQEVVENCVTYKCRHKGDQIGLDPISVGCSWNNTCFSENEIWNDTVKCVQYHCLKQHMSAGRTVMQRTVLGYGCVFNNTCMAVNTTWSDGCRTRKCVVNIRNRMIQRSIAPISAGCDDEGICRNVGYQKVTNTCSEYKCIFNDTLKDSFFSLTGGACRSSDGKCHNVGTRWTEQRSDNCLVFECRKETLGYLSRNIEQKCLDANGNCQDVGSSGFQAHVKGKLGKDCSCVATPAGGVGIVVHCKG